MRDEQREKSIRNEKILNNVDTVKESNQLRSPIYFTHIDNVISGKKYFGEEPNGFVDVPLQQDGFGNLDAKTHIGRVHSMFEPALDQAATIYGMGTRLDEMGFYVDKAGDLLEAGINSMVTSVFRKMSADFISLISSVYHNTESAPGCRDPRDPARPVRGTSQEPGQASQARARHPAPPPRQSACP